MSVPSLSIPTISGPVRGGVRGHVFAGSTRDLESRGYVEEEYFIDGVAHRIVVSESPDNGRFDSRKGDESAPYRTRLVVRRPLDPAAFNGTVIVHWTNVSIGWENISDHEAVTDGFAFVAVSAQTVGIDGFPGVPYALRAWDPERYGSLHLPGDAYSFDIFSQAAKAVGTDGVRRGVDPLDGLTVRHRVAEGASQSASRLVSQINAFEPIDPTFDGFISIVDFGAHAEFDDGLHDEVADVEYTPAGFVDAAIPMARKRDDLDAKILVINSESEARLWESVAQPDTDAHRVWFVAGGAHMGAMPTSDNTERDGLPAMPLPPRTPSLVNFSSVIDGGLHAMHRWLTTGQAPTSQPRFAVDEDGRLQRDSDGIVIGGIRLPDVAVPAASNAGEGEDMTGFSALIGSHHPFPPEKIKVLYPDDAVYVEKVKAVVDALAADRVITARAAEQYVAGAATSRYGTLSSLT